MPYGGTRSWHPPAAAQIAVRRTNARMGCRRTLLFIRFILEAFVVTGVLPVVH
jgi:hypothetical protein